MRLAGLTTLTALVQLVAEREAHERLYDAMVLVLESLESENHWPALLVRWELGLLEELGFGLDLSRCASTGTQDDLIYVSPKSGRAVSGMAGEPYRDKLLTLPSFLLDGNAADPADVAAGLTLTGYFLDRHLFAPNRKRLPDPRERLCDRIRQSGAAV